MLSNNIASQYHQVTARFLRKEERLIQSEETEMPLVLEAQNSKDVAFLQSFLHAHSSQLLKDVATYGAVLIRGFDIPSDDAFEKVLLSIEGLRGISDAFMAEEGRIHADNVKYVLQTNAIYKTGGTLYLGGFHSENYYSADVPTYISFCCFKPSLLGGETGLINMEKVYQELSAELKNKLEQKSFFVSEWLVSEVASRYEISEEAVENICKRFNLPIETQDGEQFIVMHKASIFENPETNKKSLQINLFELPTLNKALRKLFIHDYTGNTWFWHRFVWRLPEFVLTIFEYAYIICAQLYYSPKNALKVFISKLNKIKATRKNVKEVRVGSCFTETEVKTLAQLMRKYYVSCLWEKGDILLVDNRKVAHAGMPGTGPRTLRALICNPLSMNYSFTNSGLYLCKERETEGVGYCMAHYDACSKDTGVCEGIAHTE